MPEARHVLAAELHVIRRVCEAVEARAVHEEAGWVCDAAPVQDHVIDVQLHTGAENRRHLKHRRHIAVLKVRHQSL